MMGPQLTHGQRSNVDSELIDCFQNGDVELKIYKIGNEIRYWIRSGAALLEFDEKRLVQLLEIMYAFVEEGKEYHGF